MILPPLIPYHRRNTPAKKKPSPLPPTPPVDALQVLSATVVGFQEEAAIVTLVFNTSPAFPLAETSSANPEQWSMRYEGLLYVGSSIESGAYNELQLIMTVQSDTFEANALFYAGDPSDIADTAGRELAAIDGMPVS